MAAYFDGFDENDISVGDVIFYVNSDLIPPNEIEHPHIIAAIDGNDIYTICGTSQQETIERLIETRKLSYDLFPCFGSEKSNGLDKDTFFDCSKSFTIHRYTLQDKFQKGQVVNKCGKITYAQYDQIRIGLNNSKTCDFLDLLVHPED